MRPAGKSFPVRCRCSGKIFDEAAEKEKRIAEKKAKMTAKKESNTKAKKKEEASVEQKEEE